MRRLRVTFSRDRGDSKRIDPDVLFEDPIAEIRGRDALKAYYAKMYDTVIDIPFDFTSIPESG